MAGLVAHSLATALVAAGMPAVIGWDGSVDDQAATVFAGRLYGALAGGADLAVAVGDARRVLLDADDPGCAADWHLARLWLGPGGGGPLVGGTRTPVAGGGAPAGRRSFLAGKPQVPVAAAGMFVGRRPELQRALRALRAGSGRGCCCAGRAGWASRAWPRGSPTAARITRSRWSFGDYTALGVLDAVAAAVRTDPAARDLVEAAAGRGAGAPGGGGGGADRPACRARARRPGRGRPAAAAGDR